MEENVGQKGAAGGGAAGASAPPPAAHGDAPPSNTASHGYKDGKREYTLLRVGVDSVYLSFYGELFPAIDAELTQLKYHAQSRYPDERAIAQKQLGAHVFEVSDKGQQGFAYILQDGAYRICLRSGHGNRLPAAYIKVSSELLAHKPLAAIAEELAQIVAELGECESIPIVSRLDLFADFATDTDIGAIDRDSWITQASGVDTYSRHNRFTGWVFGSGGNLSARLYDKTIEILKSGKTYFHELGKQAGWNGESAVWRLEFQFRREVLQELHVQTLEQAQNKLGGLWLYGVCTWLRLTVPDPNDSNRARWPLHPIWDYLCQVRWRLDDEPLTRSYTPARVPSLERLYRMFAAILTSFMAIRGSRVYGEAVVHLMDDCRAALDPWCREKLNIAFDDWLTQKVSLKAREFNTRNNVRTERKEAGTPTEVEKNAVDYYKKSRGE